MSKEFQEPSDFFGKHVVVMGLGLHGGGQAVAQWLYAKGARVCVTDLRSEEDLQPSVRTLQNFCKEYSLCHQKENVFPIEWIFGEHRSEDMARADLIIQNPGVPYDSPYLSLARSAGVAIENEVTLFLSLTRKTPKIGVTGTRGKSTTTALIHAMLRPSRPHALCVGIAGAGIKNFFSVLDTVLEHEALGIFDPVVMELSSYQLELFSPSTQPLHIAVVTNILSDHLNRHKTFEQYARIKENIVRFQSDIDGYAIFNYDNSETRAMGKRHQSGARLWFSRLHTFDGPGTFLLPDASGDPLRRMLSIQKEHGSYESICRVEECALAGEHALENILAASAAAQCAGVPTQDIIASVKTFTGLPSRQEEISVFHGRTWINDTAATSPDATRAALGVFHAKGEKPHIILVAGGADKNLDFTGLASDSVRAVKSIVFLSGTATPRLADAVLRAGFFGTCIYTNSMHEAVWRAWEASESGDVILLSPGCASFGMFVHEFDRGEQFVSEVHALRRSLGVS
ncbi:UDP-N-acetylmuramoyl-L-alanine--D-glutamate ligase [Candidatus Uhrbacteria bacterium]|nr:UDP-N-acetylmuramoyl-L-alanine--D-glutamate ligase [Candidatus Uhrbacteria bacterium]